MTVRALADIGDSCVRPALCTVLLGLRVAGHLTDCCNGVDCFTTAGMVFLDSDDSVALAINQSVCKTQLGAFRRQGLRRLHCRADFLLPQALVPAAELKGGEG